MRSELTSLEKRKLGLLAILLFLLYFSAPVFYTENHSTKFNLTQAIVLQQTLSIDTYVVPAMSDWALHKGRHYTNKAPGPSLIGVPVYAGLVALQRWQGENPLERNFQNLYIVDAFVTKLPSALLAILFFFFLGARGVPGAWRWFLTLALGVGTIAYPFSTMLWGHQTSALFVFLTFYCLFVEKKPALAGFATAMAGLCDYMSLVLIPAVTLVALARADLRKDFGRMLLGSLLPAGTYLFYHALCFDSPFSTAVAFSNPIFGGNGVSVWAVLAKPSVETTTALLFGRERGLFFLSPALLLALWGWWEAWKRGHRSETAFVAFCFFSVLLLNTSFQGWHGGWSSGPRYLVPMIPLLAAGWAFVPRGFLLAAAVMVSAALACLIASLNPAAVPEKDLFFEEVLPRIQSPVSRFFLLTQALQVLLLFFIALDLWRLPWRLLRSRQTFLAKRL